MNKLISISIISLIVFAGCVSTSDSTLSTSDQSNTVQPPNNSETFKIEGNQTNSQNINLENQDVSIGNSARQEGDIFVKNGNIELEGNNGEISIGNSNNIKGDIITEKFEQEGNNVISGTH